MGLDDDFSDEVPVSLEGRVLYLVMDKKDDEFIEWYTNSDEFRDFLYFYNVDFYFQQADRYPNNVMPGVPNWDAYEKDQLVRSWIGKPHPKDLVAELKKAFKIYEKPGDLPN